MTSIRLHPKHGLNPTVPVCFWCGEDKGEVALLGNKYKGEAPPKMVLDYEPCTKCQELMKQGITMMEGDSASKLGRPPMNNGVDVAPTGRWVVIKEEAVSSLGLNPEFEDTVRKRRGALIEKQLFEVLFSAAIEAPREEGAPE